MSRVRLDELNPPQREAVTTLEGPLLVLAGAGSGKTRVITYRVGYLLEQGVHPSEILAVSFTNKAADEMRQRVEALVGVRAADEITLSTFHSLGVMILKREKAALGFPSGFTIYDGSDQLGVVRELLRRVNIDDRRFDPKAILFRISRAKNAFLDPDGYARSVEHSDQEYDQIAAELYPRYEESLQSFHALDFDDLITKTSWLLDRNEEVRARWSKRFRYVMVDEYQDTNRAQSQLMHHLISAHNNLCVVGDDDQSIYGWRGAEAGHILEFERQFKGAKVVRLEENYRSTPNILDAANAVIANNKKRHAKRLWTSNAQGDKLHLIVCDDAEAEAEFVAQEIEVLRATQSRKLRDFAVLYRSNIQARPLEEALRAQRLDYRVVGGQAFFERKEVKDAIAYLKLALSPRDEISLRRIINYPARGIGSTTLERLAEHGRRHGKSLFDACMDAHRYEALPGSAPEIENLAGKQRQLVAAFCDLVQRGRALLDAGEGGLRAAAKAFLEAVGIPDDLRAAAPSPLAAQRRLENLESFLDSLHRFEERQGRDLPGFLHRLTLQTQDDATKDSETDEVTLVTLHGAKGLEFPVVFLVGMEEELLPHRRTLFPQGPDATDLSADDIDLGEERRLMYVGITRARQILYLTRARARAQRASFKPRSPSRFLAEIPEALTDLRDGSAPAVVTAEDKEAFARESLAKLFKITEG